MNVAIDLVIALAVLYVVIDGVRSFTASTGTLWQRLLATGKSSATILWQRVVIAVTGLSGGLVWAADWLNAPGVATAIQSVIQPQYVSLFIVGVAVITEIARRRTL